LLVKELTLESGDRRVLDEGSDRRNIQSYGATQSFVVQSEGVAAGGAPEANGSLRLRAAAAAPASEDSC